MAVIDQAQQARDRERKLSELKRADQEFHRARQAFLQAKDRREHLMQQVLANVDVVEALILGDAVGFDDADQYAS